MLLKYLENKDLNIKEMNEADILLFIKDYLACFKHAYWANLIKVCMEKIKLYLINFMKLFNNLIYLVKI